MARTLKFRAWLKDQRVMTNPFELFDSDEDYLLNGDGVHVRNAEIMQYTGFADHVGVEIYDKDVIRFTNPAPSKKWRKSHGEKDYNDMVVSFNQQRGCWALYWRSAAGELQWASLARQLDDNHAVVGNAYENGDLIA